MKPTPGQVLIVDDNDATRYAMARVLRAKGFEVREGATAAEALAVLDNPADILLLDILLPDQLGFDVCRKLKTDPRTANMPILMVTASFTDDASRVTGLEGGADGYLVHPIEPSVLVATVQALLRNKQAEHSLLQLNSSLKDRVAERSALAVHRANQLQTLAIQLTRAEHRERRRLAQLLHDDLQQLLVAGTMKAELIRVKGGDHPDPDAIQLINILRQAISVARRLTTDLAPPIVFEGDLIAIVEWIAKDMAEKYDLRIDTSVVEPPGRISEEIGMLLFQALRELLFNIVKHAKVHRASVEVTRAGPTLVQITITDQGIGFDTDLPRQDAGNDRGFGLFSVRERIVLLGGELHLQSAPGQGTTVILVVPSGPQLLSALDHRAPVSRDAGASMDQPAGARPTVSLLLADDHKIVREGLMHVLANEADFQIVGEATSGEEAVEKVRELLPDVVILDVTMPGIGGIEATRKIRQEFPATAVIGLSMHENPRIAAEMIGAGASEFFTKDGGTQRIIGAIRTLKAGSTRRSGGATPAAG